LKSIKGYIVTFGIVPTKPETGYGYIERKGDDVISLEKTQPGFSLDFIAKNFFGTVGCFVLRLLEELKAFHPEVRKKKLVWESNTNGILDLALSMDIPSISILIMR
jgi:mannose-1-phosphate guanylyltransferase